MIKEADSVRSSVQHEERKHRHCKHLRKGAEELTNDCAHAALWQIENK
jgi:hypothetical protein